MTDMSHVNTDLMRPAGFWVEFNERPITLLSSFQYLVACLRRLTRRIHDDFCLIVSAGIDTQEGCSDYSLSWFWYSGDECEIGFLDFASAKLLGHIFVGEASETGDDDAGCIAVNTMGESRMCKRP